MPDNVSQSDRPLAGVVLAAGQGKRMRAPVPKVLVKACGRTLVEHVLEAAAPLGADPTVIVYGHGGDLVQAALRPRGVAFAHQAEQDGTGHAVQCALDGLAGFAGDVLVLCGDTPLLTTDVLQGLVADHRKNRRALTVLSANVAVPGSLGRVLRGADGRMAEIKEAGDANAAQLAVSEINTGVMVIAMEYLPDALARLKSDNAQGEFYLTDVPALLLADGLSVDAFRTSDEGAALGVNTPVELAQAVAILRERKIAELMAAGVFVDDPATTRIDAEVTIEPGTRLRPFTYVAAGVRIAADCEIGPHVSVLGPPEGTGRIPSGTRVAPGTVWEG